MALDLLPRLKVHSVLGDFLVDPWATGSFDLSRYGITGADVDLSTGSPEILLHHALGDVRINPLDPAPADLTAYGITGYEVVWGVPAGVPDLSDKAGMLLGVGLVALAVWWASR
jgi:hypothetical protein